MHRSAVRALPPTAPADSPLSAMVALPRWWPLGGVLVGGWVMGDALHLPLSAVVPLGAAIGGWWLLSGRRKPVRLPAPRTGAAWLERCTQVMAQFERLEAGDHPCLERHRQDLQLLAQRQQRSALEVALVGLVETDGALITAVGSALAGPLAVRLHGTQPLASASSDWRWPSQFEHCDHLLYRLRAPLRAADLRWLESLPSEQSHWLLVEAEASIPREQLRQELVAQLPSCPGDRHLFWDGDQASLAQSLLPLRRRLSERGRSQLEGTQVRCLRQLHGRLQGDLEGLRRQRWKQLQQRTQWVVAAGVFAAPLPSLDLLVLGIANGLMLQEMARLWDCPWSADQLRETALELGKAALALGLVEWSTQALASLIKLHGATWLVGGAIQALSAAYLTRVVSHAMADVLALSVGVEAGDLERLRRQAPVLVAQAAEAEKVDWGQFLQQAREWCLQQGTRSGSPLGAA